MHLPVRGFARLRSLVPGFPPSHLLATILAMTTAPSPTTASWRTLYPNCSQELRLGGLRYHYLDSGPPAAASETASAAADSAADPAAAAPVILCVHGNPTWSFYWRSVFERFAPAHRVIAVDHIGCGLSDKPPRGAFDYSLAAHRDHLVQLIDELDLQNIVLLAHDWGGAIGLSAAIERRERLAGVVLLNTGAFPPPYVPWRIAACRLPLLGTLAVRGANLFAKAAVTMAMSKNRLAPEVAQGLLAPYGNWHNRVAIDAFVKDIPTSPEHPTYEVLQQLESDLKLLEHLPKRLIWGMRDWCFRPECLERLLQHWPDATAVRLPEAGHYVIEDDPQATLAALGEFLQRLRPAAAETRKC